MCWRKRTPARSVRPSCSTRRRGVKKYYPIVWNAITYFLPAAAAVALILIVRNGLTLRFVLNVQ